MYALQEKGKFSFGCVADTPEQFQAKVQRAYWRWRGMQSRGATATFDEFMSKYDSVSVTVAPCHIKLTVATP